MQKRDWLTAVPLVLVYGVSFLLVEYYGVAGIYFWAGGLALWVIIAGALRTPNIHAI